MKIVKHNLFVLLKSYKILIEMATMIPVVFFVMYAMIRDLITNSLFGTSLLSVRITFHGVGIALMLATVALFSDVILQEILINEKRSRRIELLLANGVHLNDIWIGISISAFILNCMVLFLCAFSMLVPLVIFKIKISSMFNLESLLLWVVLLPVLVLAFSFLISEIGLIIRRIEIINATLKASVFIIVFGGTYVFKYVSNVIQGGGNAITGMLFLYIFIMFIILSLLFFLKKRLTKRNITLSIPD